ncbi:aldo/keto reductase [Youxingia wuxianensis]|uniref:Aldo/keto reductase n=1 Tax=Youxingia wuxianensis TaxID=2763678 RepID=A0A926EMY8_9FIRM|nr:aldo/keto reductase [Youxingia wuxianensis]MBC8584192.1 aldo/keto reductase [Youxingia wuxianensis]
MIYKEFGHTGEKTSLIGCGGMRFRKEEYENDLDKCADVVLHAYRRGINYFDSAPLYCGDHSLDIFKRAISQMDRSKIYITSKASPENTGEKTQDDMLRSIENSIKRLGVDYIDFFHLWCVLDFDMFVRYEKMGMLKAMMKAKERGLIKHINISTHASGKDIEKMLETGYFEGVLLNYNATNFIYRQEGLAAAKRLGIGVITMNPLGGGLIPRNPEFFSFLKEAADDTVAKAAIRFNASHPEINVVLAGVSCKEEVDQAVNAIENLRPVTADQLDNIKKHLTSHFNSMCTLCDYCKGCPAGIPVSKFMDTYNQYMINGNDVSAMDNQLVNLWDIPHTLAGSCLKCGACERKCTQHLPIIKRLQEIYEKMEAYHNK